MPRFFFDVNDGAEMRDEIGREVSNGAGVKTEALRVIAALLTAEAEDAAETTLVLSVRDDSGAIPLKLRMVCQVEEASNSVS
ncbi:DUF6894 family protein [Methylobacterium haplocladii]|uniref:DUF6894 family protein n=1 Tax=Methylobacterium haplocladii TaxID=1176176 RepID=UPI001EDE941E|nr:hypothetical protein [Methylobacterium haplocladii]GJD82467.1 hypothetical protein HPGCJGGD_0323 [Methylobacterium haplocladii]GLS61163.1 hypothetical protein GCM10007887_38590 [Methylobacterium haplocladii]